MTFVSLQRTAEEKHDCKTILNKRDSTGTVDIVTESVPPGINCQSTVTFFLNWASEHIFFKQRDKDDRLFNLEINFSIYTVFCKRIFAC